MRSVPGGEAQGRRHRRYPGTGAHPLHPGDHHPLSGRETAADDRQAIAAPFVPTPTRQPSPTGEQE
ncbi:hypothetical protein [Sediminicurvatus halobius]|uniref:Uncharacterized protein n=1 Tax=Sediminicurvatus halobius TaxID=2182432 RepID=A0A2U2N3I2_9GAMM|nr:hypothetical protein [Spiribacter halobius]PWG63539.1 hypothetical protein DEM34_08245 [Spiribacter halobius]UEX79582.1 hypothetical protein LMH63_08030 [Spiribacter halobius]